MNVVLPEGSLAQTLGLWVAALLTLGVLSYLVGDNPVFRLTQYLFVGVSAGYAAALAWTYVLAPRLAELIRDPGSAWPQAIALALGALMLTRAWKPLSPLARLPLALLLGVGAAVAIGGALRGTLVPQVAASMVSVAPVDYGGGLRGWAYALDAATLLAATIAVLAAYQYHAADRTGPAPLRRVASLLGKGGRAIITIVVAALLAGAALSFYSALRGQFDFLLFGLLGGRGL